ncbi:MAG TPA: hypothetical protein VEK80_04035 [Kribbellaceae bacterium]|nr:hypothetical protein [Kribbellaceae bacterium]
MGTPREDLHALVDSLPDDVAADVLDFARAKLHAGQATPFERTQRTWPPAWFGAGQASHPDVSERVDEILRDEFGRRPA